MDGEKVFIAIIVAIVVIFGGVSLTLINTADKQFEEVSSALEEKSYKWEKAVADKDSKYFIDGEPVSDSFNPEAINIANYSIEFDDDNVYLNKIERGNYYGGSHMLFFW